MADPQREDLERLRATLWAALEDADVAVKAQIAGQLRAVVKDLAALGGGSEKRSVVDELKARRARQAGGDPPAGRRSQPRRSTGRDRTS